LYGYMMTHPGKKLLFMGNEIGQWKEWNHDQSLDWDLLQYPLHSGLQRWVRDLNTFYRAWPALYELDAEWGGFEWIDCNDSQRSILSYRRKGRDPEGDVLCVCNFTPQPQQNYRIGVPSRGDWQEILNGDAQLYGGSGQGNLGTVSTAPVPMHGRPYSLNLYLPPLAMIALRRS
jgi:1,4-alpha-glucan branching enzyme